MKVFIKFAMIFIMIGVIYSCESNTNHEIHYQWQQSVDLPVFQETSSLDLVSLILEDDKHELDHSKITYDLSSVNFNVVGTYEVDVQYLDQDKKEQTQKVFVHVVDKVKPNIIGLKDYTLNLNSDLPNFLLGVTATDNYDGIIALSLSNFDLSQLKLDTVGRYNVKVTVVDSSDNEAVKNFTVIIVDPDVAYVILFNDTVTLPQFEDNYDFEQLIQSVKNDENEDLLDLGYTLQFDQENIKYDTIGSYSLAINLRDPDGVVVKTVYSSIKMVPAIEVVFKNDKDINLNDEQFKPEELIDHITTYDGKIVTLGENYQLKLNQPIDTSILGSSQYQYTIVDKFNHILYQKSITITVKQLTALD